LAVAVNRTPKCLPIVYTIGLKHRQHCDAEHDHWPQRVLWRRVDCKSQHGNKVDQSFETGHIFYTDYGEHTRTQESFSAGNVSFLVLSSDEQLVLTAVETQARISSS